MTAVAAVRVRIDVPERRSVLAGLVGAGALLAGYLGLLSLAQSPDHAIEQLGVDAPFVALIAAGFGAQVALLLELRRVAGPHRAGAAVTAASTGTSGAAMLACCAHHLVDLLPFLGLSAATVFLDSYRTPLLLAGIGLNALGIALMRRQLVRARHACAAAAAA